MKLENIIKENEGTVPKLLLHSCCAPCSSYVIEYLSQYFEIIVYYYNPNISPRSEFDNRAKEQERLIEDIDNINDVTYIKGRYVEDEFNKIAKGLEAELEGGARCFRCYHLRMEDAAEKALELGCDYFTTTLSISPYKNSEKLNQIGEALASKKNIKYLYADFKKKNGYKRSIELSKEHDLYRQDYCGCSFSYEEMLTRKENKDK